MDVRGLVAGRSGIVFDLFHTLCAIEIAMPQLPPESWQIMELEEGAWSREWRASATARNTGQMRDVAQGITEAARRVFPEVSPDLVAAAIASRQAKFRQALTNVEDEVLETLAALRESGKRLALLSNADTMEVAAWPQSPLATLFDAAVFSCDAGLVKPDPQAYLEACRLAGLSPGDCVFVGDGGSDELAGARRVGMRAVQMTGIVRRFWPEVAAERGQGADAHIVSLAELLPPHMTTGLQRQTPGGGPRHHSLPPRGASCSEP